MKVGVVIVHFETPGDLAACLSSVAASTVDVEIVVVDNSVDQAMRDETGQVCLAAGVRLERQEHNLGFAAGCNEGVRSLPDAVDAFLFVNPDARLGPTTAFDLAADLDAHPRLGAVNPVIKMSSDTLWFAGGTLNRWLARLTQVGFGEHSAPDARPTSWVNGCVLLVRRGAFTEVGGFDEDYFLYWEDVVLSLRLIEAGWDIGVVNTTEVLHLRGRSGSPVRAIGPTQIEHSIRSRIIFVRKELRTHERPSAFLYTFVNVIRLVQLGSLGTGRLMPAAGAAARGVRAGLR